MGKSELKKRISELNSASKSKSEIYRELEPEVPEKLKFWVMLKVFLLVRPELLKKYRPYNNLLIAILVIQLIFSFHFFPMETEWTFSSQIIFLIAAAIYLLLMIGILNYKLISYYSLAVFCAANIVSGIPFLFSPMWPKMLISSLINLMQIIFTVWLANRLFPDILDSKEKIKKKNVLSHI